MDPDDWSLTIGNSMTSPLRMDFPSLTSMRAWNECREPGYIPNSTLRMDTTSCTLNQKMYGRQLS
jgi:hypothetical protein